jgi:hypothetical protein
MSGMLDFEADFGSDIVLFLRIDDPFHSSPQ